MGQVIDLQLGRQARWARRAIEAIKDGQEAQFRAARLGGQEVVVFGHNQPGGRYRPMLVAVDDDLAATLRDYRTTPGPGGQAVGGGGLKAKAASGRRPRADTPRPLDWYTARLDQATAVFNLVDEGRAAGCRYATLGPDMVIVFGLVGWRGFEPAFLCIDEALGRRLSDLRELHLDQAAVP